jgi:IS5 family transposase
VAKTRLHTLCPLIGEIERARRRLNRRAPSARVAPDQARSLPPIRATTGAGFCVGFGSARKGRQFVTHVKALPGNPYDGHTLATVIPDMEALVGNIIERLLLDKGYRGHNAPPEYKFRVFTSGQKRRVTPQIKRELRRRSAVEPVIGHLKSEHRMGRNYLWHQHGDAINAVLAAAGYNFRRLFRWLEFFLHQILVQLIRRLQLVPS